MTSGDLFGALIVGVIGLVAIGLVIGMVVGFVYFICWCFSPSHEETATVVDKYYMPSHTGIGPALGGNGGVAVTFTSEEYTVSVKLKSGDTYEIELDEDDFHKVNRGDKIKVSICCVKMFNDICVSAA